MEISKLKQFLLENGITAKKLAKKTKEMDVMISENGKEINIGITESTISHIINKNKDFKYNLTGVRILSALSALTGKNVTPNDIFDY